MTQIPQTNLELSPIGNCQVTGLIDETGGLVWGCIPRVDGDPVFSCTNSPRCGGFDDAAASWAGIDDSPPVVPPFATDDEGDYVSSDGFDYINDDECGLGF